MDYHVLHGCQVFLTGNSDFTHPVVAFKFHMARQDMDAWLCARSHADHDYDPSYGRHSSGSLYEANPGFDDIKTGGGGNLAELGWRWNYVAGLKLIEIDHWEPEPGGGDETITEKVYRFHLIPALAAFEKVGSQYYEVGFITLGDASLQGPYEFHEIQQGVINFHSAPLFPWWWGHKSRWGYLGWYPDLEEIPPMQYITTVLRLPSDEERKAGFAYEKKWFEVKPLSNHVTTEPDWEGFYNDGNPAVPYGEYWGEGIPLPAVDLENGEGPNQFDYGKWDGPGYSHSFGPGCLWGYKDEDVECWIDLRKATWYSGWAWHNGVALGSDMVTHILKLGECTPAGLPTGYAGGGGYETSGLTQWRQYDKHEFTSSIWPYEMGENARWPSYSMLCGDKAWALPSVAFWGHWFYYGGIRCDDLPDYEPWPSKFPGKYYWDLVPRMDTIGTWYQWGGVLSLYEASVRIGTTAEGSGGSFRDGHGVDHLWMQGNVVYLAEHYSSGDTYEDEDGQICAAAFYYDYSIVDWKFEWNRTFINNCECGELCENELGHHGVKPNPAIGSEQPWPWSWTSIYQSCPCYTSFNCLQRLGEPGQELTYPLGWHGDCGYLGKDCNSSESNEEIGEEPPPGAEWRLLVHDTTFHPHLQFDGATYCFSEFINTQREYVITSISDYPISYQDCFPYYFIYGEQSTFWGSMTCGKEDDMWHVFSFIRDGVHSWLKVPAKESESVAPVGHMSPFPYGGLTYNDKPLYVVGVTRLMVLAEEKEVVDGPLPVIGEGLNQADENMGVEIE